MLGSFEARAALLLGLALLAPAAGASAQGGPSGSFTGYFLLAHLGYACDGCVAVDPGGGALFDLGARLGLGAPGAPPPSLGVTLGGFFGGVAVPSARDSHNIIFMPLGVALTFDIDATDPLFARIRVRAGGWTGATQSEKITGGAFFGGGLALGVGLGHGASISFGVELWGVIASDAWRDSSSADDAPSASQLMIGPHVAIAWDPEPAEPIEEDVLPEAVEP